MDEPERAGLALVCEGCGYAVDGLREDLNCPECGRPIATSMPERRTGSTWQRTGGLAGWWSTNVTTLRRPGVQFEVVRVERRRSTRLAQINALLAAGVAIAPLAVTRTLAMWPTGEPIVDFASQVRAPSKLAAIQAGLTWLLVAMGLAWVGLMVLTAIEARGLRFFGARRGWRSSRDVAWAVCGHASVGWIIAGVLWAAGSLLAGHPWLLRLENIAWLDPVRPVIRLGPAILGGFAGMMVFETLAYVGFRAMRFANAPRAASMAPDRDTGPVAPN